MNINHICMSCMTELNEEGICPNCHTDNASNRNDNRHLPVRTILRGKYLVGRVIGEGGFGITYIGYDLDLQICVAIKEFCPRELAGREMTDQVTLLPYNAESEEFFEAEKEKFIDEARRLAKFRSEQGVVSVLDYFKENKTAYIVMEYIEGVTLRKYLNMLNVHMQLDELLVLLKPLMETLEKIHKANIVHRDISPDNIMISRDRKKVYLIDFGTARAFDTEHSMSTYRKGSYTPVEQQSRRGNQGPWTDVYALCATIYYCITGKNIPESVERVMEDDLVPPSKLGVGITSTMEEALLKGLAVRPENRTQSIEKLMEELYGVKGAEKEAVVENKEQDEDVTLPISEEKKDFVIPLDAEGNVDIDALPITQEIRKELDKRIFVRRIVGIGVLIGVFSGSFYIVDFLDSILLDYYPMEKIASMTPVLVILSVLICLWSVVWITPLIISHNQKKMFVDKLDSAILCRQIEAISESTVKNDEVFRSPFGEKITRRDLIDYYNNIILPETNISQELKDAWLCQAKKSGIWIDE